jgi:hypothetical protein
VDHAAIGSLRKSSRIKVQEETKEPESATIVPKKAKENLDESKLTEEKVKKEKKP